jgi:hypothetical protein
VSVKSHSCQRRREGGEGREGKKAGKAGKAREGGGRQEKEREGTPEGKCRTDTSDKDQDYS